MHRVLMIIQTFKVWHFTTKHYSHNKYSKSDSETSKSSLVKQEICTGANMVLHKKCDLLVYANWSNPIQVSSLINDQYIMNWNN